MVALNTSNLYNDIQLTRSYIFKVTLQISSKIYNFKNKVKLKLINILSIMIILVNVCFFKEKSK